MTTHWLCGLEKVTLLTLSFSFSFPLHERTVRAVGTSGSDTLGILLEVCSLASLLFLPPLIFPLRVPKQNCLPRPPVKQGEFLATTLIPSYITFGGLGHQRLRGSETEKGRSQITAWTHGARSLGEWGTHQRWKSDGRRRERKTGFVLATLEHPRLSDPRGLPQAVLTLGPLVTMSDIGKGVGSKKTRKNQRG